MPRIVVVERERCNPVECGNYLCIRFCPVNRAGKECIVEGSDRKVNISEELCTGCGICVKKCPFEALHVINLPEELKSAPIHQYGKNGFRLYSLPTPIFGKVVGILGRNGIGKSTAIKILAQQLKPNMGGENGADISELISFFKGSEAQIFFERVKAGKIKVSYKPQAVDLVPKQFKGKVRALLERADEKGELKEIAEALELKDVLESDISLISSGELQRVAIAATVLKKANLYVFDEPTSYLDVKQRVNVSRFIKQLAGEETAVLVVEHDLIILDHMTDLVHIMYGKEGCYGVVSQPKVTRAAINTYLGGYLKEENIRFRDKPIAFAERPAGKLKPGAEIVSWTELEKRLDSFVLEARPGSLHKQVTGVLGANGIGKTTFVKMLAGVISPDKGELTKKVSVSYKPQYLSTGSDELVASFLKEAIQKFEVQLIRPLDLKRLLTKNLSQLSGGELQRVAIASCLSKDADLFLLDEPSAYLDVEQRLAVSKIIRERIEQGGKSAIVVDHDILFIDYLSESLMVLLGKPARHGSVNGPFHMEQGMNMFLSELDITMRRDKESKRPRINKEGSQMDRKQKEEGKRYYS